MAAAPAEKALVVAAAGEKRLDEVTRKVDSSILPKEIRSPLEERLRELMPQVEKHFEVELAGCESPQYLVYRTGDFFKPQTDSGNVAVQRRRVSAVIFLNSESQEPAEDSYGGGHLTFYGLLKGPHWEKCAFPLQAEPDLLIAFPSNKLHEVTPVLHGRCFTVVTWFYSAKTAAVAVGARSGCDLLYSQRNTFAESAVQTTNTTTSPATSPLCADHASPLQIPCSKETA